MGEFVIGENNGSDGDLLDRVRKNNSSCLKSNIPLKD